jgi:hypothetical protein
MTVAHFFQGWKQREVLIVLGLAVASMLLWRVPWLGWIFYPFHLFGTFVHELSHGLAAILTGGKFVQFIVRPNFSGVATTAGGVRWVVVSAGYLGSALFGGLLVIISAWGVSARAVLLGLGVILGIMCLLFVRSIFGLVTGFLFSAGLIAAGLYLNTTWASGLLLFLAVQSMLDAVDSVFDLIKLSTHHRYITTDAQIMQSMTFIPAVFWAILWTGISLTILFFSLSIAYRQNPKPIV